MSNAHAIAGDMPIQPSAPVTDTVLDRRNAVALSAPQLEAAQLLLAALPDERRGDAGSELAALLAYAQSTDVPDARMAAQMLHARVTALAQWQQAHDPARTIDPRTALEAAARMPLELAAGDLAFDPAGFQELLLFIDELPW